MSGFLAFLAVGVIALIIGIIIGRAMGAGGESTLAEGESAEGDDDLYALAQSLGEFYEAAPYAAEFLGHPVFEQGVRRLCDESVTVDTLLGYYNGNSAILACMALEALARRKDDRDVRDEILAHINDYVPWNRYFALRVLDARSAPDESISGRLLPRLDESWEAPIHIRILREFLEKRAEGGEQISLGSQAENLSEETAQQISGLLDRLPVATASGVREELKQWRSTRIDRPFLDSIGTVWSDPGYAGSVLSHDALNQTVTQIETTILRGSRRSVLLVGEHGVGKTCIARSVAARLIDKGWIIFEAGHTEMIAGLPYIGEVEGRMRKLLERLSGRPVLWIADNFHTLALAGRHRYGPTSVLDFLLPHLEGGQVVMLGETRPGAYERLIQSKPRVLTAMETCRVAPLSEKETLALVDRWADARSPYGHAASRETRHEAWMLAQQYLGDRTMPGNVLDLLELTYQRLDATESKTPRAIEVDDLIATLSQLTGLPATILDERQGLDLAALRRFFETHVMSQSEAVDCLVERVAMIKAGVADPTRPFGVFLFAGPTGTGKTEIAKALAEFLFGSPERMIRLDMSEFQNPESIQRIIGETPEEERGGALVARIRKQPFSVVLLDEFEKAHPSIWDVFLQMFDDGRLTDRVGNTADFRHAIVILTSNLGGMLPSGAGLGFVDAAGGFNANSVIRDVERSFRKELLNRIDRIVVFQPLGRETMREILRKELTEAFHRRGLRNRTWAVEWDEGAIEFLLTRGFTAHLGARPLKRAIERHLLAPLATTIVNHQYPEGDQFLFVRAEGDRLVVEFVDPDAPEPAPAEAAAPTETHGPSGELPSLERITLEARGTAGEIGVLQAAFERLNETVWAPSWQDAKQKCLDRTREPEFWASGERFAVLGHFEYLDRIQAGLKSAGSLLERLTGRRGQQPRDLVQRLAQQLYLLDRACNGVLAQEPRDAFLLVEAWSDAGVASDVANAFARRITDMYRAWASERRMQCHVLEGSDGDETRPYRFLASVTGYAAYSILALEEGLHVMEFPEDEGRGYRRAAARVRVCAQPDAPAGGGKALVDQAHDGLAARNANLAVVRRYREKPSPLVRDARGWRTGKLDRVLAGHFDLLGAVVDSSAAAD